MKLKPTTPGPFRIGRLAFTFTELLVVLGVLALLMLITLPALAGTSSQTKIAQCAANLRQFNSSLQMHAADNNDALPIAGGFPSIWQNWAWDVPGELSDLLTGYGVNWRALYCPGTAPLFNESDNWSLYNFYAGSPRVLGYVATLPDTPSLASSNVNFTLTPKPIQLGFGASWLPTPSERVLVADATISQPGQSNPAQRSNYNYTSIKGDNFTPHLSAHLAGHLPSGGNLSMLDGHVEWLEFEKMTPRTTGSSTAVFWW